jgi:hypothetical protein
MDLKRIECEDVQSINVPQKIFHFQAVVNYVWMLQEVGDFDKTGYSWINNTLSKFFEFLGFCQRFESATSVNRVLYVF